jgi:DNA-binding HxlR family transcriptional regulator
MKKQCSTKINSYKLYKFANMFYYVFDEKKINFTCPLELTHDITKGKWKPIILWQLGKTVCSLSKLRNDIKGISQKMLLEQLKDC